jgi:SAM-dependent methyltransferase
MEQTTPLYTWLKPRFPRLIGSEYLPKQIPPGASLNGIRNEDATHLTIADESLDYLLSFDVFEHIPNYSDAFREAARCLKPNGILLFTAPFVASSLTTIVRAKRHANGAIDHLLPPEYHGDPLNPTDGVLCYQHFGWDILDLLKSLGFPQPAGLLLWSRRFGYLGEQIFFVAGKAGADMLYRDGVTVSNFTKTWQ